MLWRFILGFCERRRLGRRALFLYHDGARWRWGDPAEIWRKLLSHPKMNFADMMPLAHQGHEPESGIVLAALAEIFDVRPWDEVSRSGLTNWEVLDLLRQFDEYLSALKKSTNPSRMPWQLSAYGYSPGQDSPDPATNSSADSSSTPNESSTGEATPCSEPSLTP